MNKKVCLGLVLLLGIFAILQASSQETILIKNATIVPVVGAKIVNGSLLIQKGKITQIGTSINAPADAKVIDAKGMSVYPGFVSPFTAIGVTGAPGAGNDTDEIGVSTAQMDPYDAINPEDDCIEVTRIDGVTTVMTVSGTRNVINGKTVVMNLEGDFAQDLLMKRYVAQVFNTGARRPNSYPSTSPGVVSFIRDKLNQTKLYADKKTESAKPDLELEALVPVIKKEVPALFITNDEVTIRNALEIIKEYDLRGIILASADAQKFADQLAKERIPVIWSGALTVPKDNEPYDINLRTAGVLSARGVLLAFESGRGAGSRNVRNLPVPAGMSVAHGLSEEDAIKAITINPAKILGIDDQVGSLEVGKIANVVIWRGSPIQLTSRVHTVIIKGKVIPLTSVQTRLRDKFEKLVKDRMKKE